jgi:uncharacterized membrane protein
MEKSRIHRLLQAAETVDVGDDRAAGVQRTLRRALDRTRADGLLRGRWLGHPVHPFLVTVPIGAWTSAAVLDLTRGQEAPARRLVGTALLSMAPTALTGLADWSALDERQRRVGVLHATGNALSALCLALSYRARAQGRHRAGRAWLLAGALPLSAAGALGGHLSYAQGAGVRRWQDGD